MFDLKLFLAFDPGDPFFQKELQKTNPYFISSFIGNSDYLEEISFEGKKYLGKYLTFYPTLEQLELLEKHLLSILSKLTPHYPFSHNPPLLLTIDTAMNAF